MFDIYRFAASYIGRLVVTGNLSSQSGFGVLDVDILESEP